MSDDASGPTTSEEDTAPASDGDDVALEVHVEPEVVPLRRRAWLAVISVAAIAAAVAQPWSVVSIALPVLFAWIGYRVAIARERPYTLRVASDGIELLTAGCRDRVGWSHVESVARGPATFTTLRFAGGGALQIPARALPDREALIGALPGSVRIEEPQPPASPAAKRRQSVKTLLLWAVLMVVFYAVYQLVGSRP